MPFSCRLPPPFSIVDDPALQPYTHNFGNETGDNGIIGLVGGQPIGANWIRLIRGFAYVDAQTPELTITITPQYRGQGIGTQLLTALFAITDPAYPTLSLSVDVANPAHHLYQRFGFKVITEKDGTNTMLRTSDNR